MSINLTVTVKLSTGKEIILTLAEAKELLGMATSPEYTPWNPYIYPTHSPYPSTTWI